MQIRRLSSLLVVTAIAAGSLPCFAVPPAPKIQAGADPLRLDSTSWKQMARFAPVKNGGRSCTAFTPPQALSERAPLGLENETQARLNFVVTREGEVSGIVVLHLSAGDERNLIGAVMGWRFRPAMCDGVPTESEADLELSSRR
ncbi:MAG: hypothetical protein JO041_07390 [Acidobacteria bacterium]|nr:hypothetical protein [Acidobacteriota bacterium]